MPALPVAPARRRRRIDQTTISMVQSKGVNTAGGMGIVPPLLGVSGRGTRWRFSGVRRWEEGYTTGRQSEETGRRVAVVAVMKTTREVGGGGQCLLLEPSP
jgi:hypothetical protein